MTSSKTAPFIAWQHFASDKEQANYPLWPSEVMVKVLFGNYLKHKPAFGTNMRVLDVGCGFGNNLLPFLVKGYECFGVEVTRPMAAQTQRILKKRGFSATIKAGTNDNLPFSDCYFDLLVSLNVIHYQATLKQILTGLIEYKRVLKPRGQLFLMTVGKSHDIIRRAKKVKAHQYQIQNYDFRDGTNWFCFETQTYLRVQLSHLFNEVEIGRVSERLMKNRLDFLIAAVTK